MIVVSDTSPIRYLLVIQKIEVLWQLLGQVLNPRAVAAELSHASAPLEVRKWLEDPPKWLMIASVDTILPDTSSIDLGEAEAITLAARNDSSVVILDDRKGRTIAHHLNIQSITTVGVVLLAAEKKLLDFSTTISALRASGMYLSTDVIDRASQIAKGFES